MFGRRWTCDAPASACDAQRAVYESHGAISRPHLLRSRHSHTCKVYFSREFRGCSEDPLLLAQSLTAKSREFVHQHQDSTWQQPHHSSSSHSSSGLASWALGSSSSKQRQVRSAANGPVAIRGSSNSWLRRIWPLNRPPSSSSVAGAQRAVPATAAVSAADVLAADAVVSQVDDQHQQLLTAGAAAAPHQEPSGNSSDDSASNWAAFGTNLHSGNKPPADSSSSSGLVGSHAPYASMAYALGADAVSITGVDSHGSGSTSSAQQQQQQHIALQANRTTAAAAAAVSLLQGESIHSNSSTSKARSAWSSGDVFATRRGGKLSSSRVAPAAVPAATEATAASVSSSSSPVPAQPAASNSGSSRSSSNSTLDDSDWLTAVLAVSTSKLSVHSNAVLTNSLKRLASLRLGSSSAGAAAAVEGSEGLAGLLDSVRVRFTTFGLQHFEEVALQLSQLGYQPDDDWLASFERHSLPVMPGGSPRLLSRLLMARVKLSGTCSPTWCAALLEAMTAQPERLTVSSWVNALWALVKVQHTPSRQFQTIFFSSTGERLDDVSPELLTNLVWSLARLKMAPSYLWWRSLITAAATVEKAFSHGQLASLVHSVALWATPGGIHARDVQRFIDLLLVEVDEQLSVMQPAELTTIVWSLGSLTSSGKFIPDWELHGRLLAAIQGQLPRLNPVQLTSLCWGLAKLDYGLPEGFADALLLEVQAQVQGFGDADLANVMWGLARMGLVPSEAFSQSLWEELHSRCSTLSLSDVSTILWAVARLQLQPPADLLTEISQHTLSVLREQPGDAVSLTNLICALGQLQAQPGGYQAQPGGYQAQPGGYQAQPDRSWIAEVEQLSLQVLPSAGLPELVNLAKGVLMMKQGPPSPTWQAAVLREVRLRCRQRGVELDCVQLVRVLAELGIQGLEDGAALANQSFWNEESGDNGYCSVQFQSGCR